MRDYLRKLLDEDNRQADMALLSIMIGIIMSVGLTLFVVIPALMVTWKTGKIDNSVLGILGMWMGVAFGGMAVDKKWAAQKQKLPDVSKSSASPSPVNQPGQSKPASNPPNRRGASS